MQFRFSKLSCVLSIKPCRPGSLPIEPKNRDFLFHAVNGKVPGNKSDNSSLRLKKDSIVDGSAQLAP